MIHRISIENFFSIAEKQEISFAIPKNVTDLDAWSSASSADKSIYLPTYIGFFGANASGKTTILKSVVAGLQFLVNSFHWHENMISLYFQPYRNKQWWGKPSKFSVEFDTVMRESGEPMIFRYDLHIAHNHKEPFAKNIVYEALSYKSSEKFSRLYEREGQTFYFSKHFSIQSKDPRKDSIRPNASVISTLAQFNHPIASFLRNYSNDSLQTNIVINRKEYLNIQEVLEFYFKNAKCLKRLNQELIRLDLGLESMLVEKGTNGFVAKFKHSGLDDSIYFYEESSGTQNFINIFPRLYMALLTGSIAIIDEIDVDLHPLLLPEIMNWFGSKATNLHGAQLLFTAHNPAILDQLQKEQLFLVEKPQGSGTQAYCASKIKGLRRSPSLMKKYLMGELGATPYIG